MPVTAIFLITGMLVLYGLAWHGKTAEQVPIERPKALKHQKPKGICLFSRSV